MFGQILKQTWRTRRLAYGAFGITVLMLGLWIVQGLELVPLTIIAAFMLMAIAYHITGSRFVATYWVVFTIFVLATVWPKEDGTPVSLESLWWLEIVNGLSILASFFLAILLPSAREKRP